MKKIVLSFAVIFILLSSLICAPHFSYADIDVTLTKELNLKAAPLDISLSQDGQYIFVLVPGEILVFSKAENKFTDSIPVDKSIDRLRYSATDNSLLLTSSTVKKLKILQIEISKKIDISNLPFKGPKNAPVTIAVFSDYQ